MSSRAVGEEAQCQIEFEVPYDLGKFRCQMTVLVLTKNRAFSNIIGPGVFLYYKLTNYYQNHRRYVQSMDTGQLHGDAVSA